MKEKQIHLQYDGELALAVGSSRRATRWENTQIKWSRLVERLRKTERTLETYEEYVNLSKQEQDEIKDKGGFVGGILKEGKRTASHVVSRQLLALDVDFAPVGFWEDIGLFFNFGCCLYSTHKHTLDKPRFRLLLPLSRPVDGQTYERIGRKLADIIGREYFDETTYQPNRLMYWPSTSCDGVYVFEYQDGPWIDVDQMLGLIGEDQVKSLGLESFQGKGELFKLGEKQEDPTTKEGLIGTFCRTYSVPEAIEHFLKEVYFPCEVPNRYTYKEGSTAAGLVIYEGGKFAYSHHASDPAGGQLCNAFDLVRLHLFGELDKGVGGTCPVGKRPSYTAMIRWVQQDGQTKKTLGEERVIRAQTAFEVEGEEERDWMMQLAMNKEGRYLCTIENMKLILTYDPRLKNKMGYDEFSYKPIVKGDLPWRKMGSQEVWMDSDDSALRHYMEHVYGITGPQKLSDAVAIVQEMNKFHPVREYLDTLKWDGKKRLEKLLVDYLGAPDEPYTYRVTKKVFTAAVTRIYKPGIKFDHMIVLTGSQGVGKSTLIGKMGKEWYSDSFSTVVGKEAYEQLHGFWIIEMAELSAIKKVEVEAVKHFISKQEDSYRQAYSRRVGSYKRQCVFFGTTNDFEFLRDRTGNRRFWPIKVKAQMPKKSVFRDLGEVEIDQLWAEAKAYYEQGEPLYLDYEMEQVALEKQEEHRECDVKAGLIREYLERPLPKEWYEMDLGSRRATIHGNALGEMKEGEMIRDKVCALEIWCELFQGDPKNLTQLQTREINSVLEQMGNWQKLSYSIRFGKLYGKQRGYKRKEEE